MLSGMRVIESPLLTEPREVRRTWYERLFTRPWRPLGATRTVQVPSKTIYRIGPDVLLMHPATLRELVESMKVEKV